MIGDLFCVHTIMSSANGSSRLLVGCCCVTFISVLFFCVGFVRLELELRSHRERILALEQEQKVNETVKDAPPSSEGKRLRLIKLRILPAATERSEKSHSQLPSFLAVASVRACCEFNYKVLQRDKLRRFHYFNRWSKTFSVFTQSWVHGHPMDLFLKISVLQANFC